MFIKNDKGFICVKCNKKVEKLKYTSRDHCNYCLHSLHVDLFPGDRLNKCKGILMPINVEETSKKGKVIVFRCLRCGQVVRNIAADDDNKEVIYEIVRKFSNKF